MDISELKEDENIYVRARITSINMTLSGEYSALLSIDGYEGMEIKYRPDWDSLKFQCANNPLDPLSLGEVCYIEGNVWAIHEHSVEVDIEGENFLLISDNIPEPEEIETRMMLDRRIAQIEVTADDVAEYLRKYPEVWQEEDGFVDPQLLDSALDLMDMEGNLLDKVKQVIEISCKDAIQEYNSSRLKP